jgi:YHS domain-containing protein
LLWRLLLGLALGYVAFQVMRKVGQSLTGRGREGKVSDRRQPDLLVQDPVCKTFIPRKEALKWEKDGKDYFFCSEGCLKRFQRSGRA